MLHRFCKSRRKGDPDGDTVPLKGPWQEKNAFEFKRKLRFWHADLLSFQNRYSGHSAFLEQWQNCPKAWCQGISEYHIWNKAKKRPSLWSAAGKITAQLKHWDRTWKLREVWILLRFTWSGGHKLIKFTWLLYFWHFVCCQTFHASKILVEEMASY